MFNCLGRGEGLWPGSLSPTKTKRTCFYRQGGSHNWACPSCILATWKGVVIDSHLLALWVNPIASAIRWCLWRPSQPARFVELTPLTWREPLVDRPTYNHHTHGQCGALYSLGYARVVGMLQMCTRLYCLHGGRAGDTFAIKIIALFLQRNYSVRVWKLF